MNVYIASVLLLIIGAAYAILLKRKLAETVFLAVVTVTGVLYCFGLINRQGCLLYGIYLIIALSFAGVLFLLYNFIKRRQNFHDAEVLKGCLIYVCFLIFSLFVNYGRTFQGWDEFSHWGTIVKHFYIVDALGTVKHANYDILLPAYFPSTSLFQYFFSRFSNKFTEYYSYIGINFMYFSLVMPFIKNIFTKKNWGKTSVLLAVFIMTPLTVSLTNSESAYSVLDVDMILGAFFGFSLLYYFAYKYEDSLYGVLMVSASIFMLTITKDIGLLFSMIVIGVIAVDIVFFKRVQIKNILYKEAGFVYKIKKALLLILPIVGSLFVKISWSNLINRSNIHSIWHIPTINEICRFFSGQLEQYQKEISHNFFFAMFKQKIPHFNISIVTFSIIITVIILILLLNYKKIESRRIITSTLLLIMGLFGYQFILALMYTFSFSMYEGLHLISYGRYTSTYMMTMTLFITIFYIIEQNEQINWTKLKEFTSSDEYISKSSILLLISVVLFITMINTTKSGIFHTLVDRIKNPESFKPRPTAIAAEKWKHYFEFENPYFIVQGGSGLTWAMMRYELMPYSKLANEISPDGKFDFCISTKPYFTDDIWTFIVTPEEWEKHVLNMGYKLLYIFKSDEILENTYGHFFQNGVQEDMCYYVKNEDGRLILVPVIEGLRKRAEEL